jgi:hypothetical protein
MLVWVVMVVLAAAAEVKVTIPIYREVKASMVKAVKEDGAHVSIHQMKEVVVVAEAHIQMAQMHRMATVVVRIQ